MFVSDKWNDYELLDVARGERLERWGKYVFVRPDPQAIVEGTGAAGWAAADARYIRSSSGGGAWDFRREIPDFTVSYGKLRFHIRPTGFKHMGLFPEQAANWDWAANLIRERGSGVRVLNLFAYTGAATAACAAAGAAVTHVDAAKGMVGWARDNAALCGLGAAPVRYLVDDCMKFVARDIRRGARYDAVIMDPPSYGRGPGGEVWRLESALYDLVEQTLRLMSDKPLFFLINSYTTGFSSGVLEMISDRLIRKSLGGRAQSGELGLPISAGGVLPCGASLRWETTER